MAVSAVHSGEAEASCSAPWAVRAGLLLVLALLGAAVRVLPLLRLRGHVVAWHEQRRGVGTLIDSRSLRPRQMREELRSVAATDTGAIRPFEAPLRVLQVRGEVRWC